MLFANQKSKDANLDTVYDFSSIMYDEDVHCTNLTNFSFHVDRMGFRLPTESEWVKGATRKDSTFTGFSGTVMEWTNDNLGKFKDTTILNYAGAANANDIGERVVKGAFNKADTTKINVISRGDVYEVTSSSRTNYVGFRLAIGIIPTPTFLNPNGSVTISPITIHASSADLWTYTKTEYMKLAFRNDETGNLNYLDYAEDGRNIVEIKDTIPVYHPDISPDGQRVAFCTGHEGISSKSELYVRNLDENGSGLVKLDAENAAIPRWSILKSGDTVITYVTDAGDNKDYATFTTKSTWQVTFAGGKFGTPYKLFSGNYHGGISEDENLAVTGAKLLRARIGDKDTIWNDGEQACNASLAKDFSKRTIFLDFGKKNDNNFVGTKYGVHEYLFVADSTSNLIQAVHAPSGYTFDHTEWTLGKVNENIVTTLTNTNGAHTKIALVNLKDSSITNLAEGVELWHPSLWIRGQVQSPVQSSSSKAQSSSSDNANNPATLDESSSSPSFINGNSLAVDESSSSSSFINGNSVAVDESSSSSSFNDDNLEQTSSESISSSENVESSGSNEDLFELDLDSAGMYYNTSGVYPNADRWRYKMEFLWQYRDTANVIALGSSRMENAFAPLAIKEPVFAVNLAVSGNSIMGSSLFLEKYIYHHMKKLKVIVLDLDIDRWWDCNNPLLNNPYKNYMGYVYDQNHNVDSHRQVNLILAEKQKKSPECEFRG